MTNDAREAAARPEQPPVVTLSPVPPPMILDACGSGYTAEERVQALRLNGHDRE